MLRGQLGVLLLQVRILLPELSQRVSQNSLWESRASRGSVKKAQKKKNGVLQSMTRSVRLVLVFRHYCNSCLRRIIQMSHVPRKYKRRNKNRVRAKLSSSQIRLLQHSRHHCNLKICNSWLNCTMKRGSQELAHSVLDDLKPSHYCIKHASRSKYSTKLLTPQD